MNEVYLASESGSQPESLNVRRKNQDRNLGINMRDRLKSRHRENTCHFCKKNEYIRANCYILKNRNKTAGATDKEM